LPSPRGSRSDPEDSNKSHPGKVLGLLLRVFNGGQVMHQRATGQAPLFVVPLPVGNRPETKEGLYPGAEGQNG